jgi:hypothetical protein
MLHDTSWDLLPRRTRASVDGHANGEPDPGVVDERARLGRLQRLRRDQNGLVDVLPRGVA